MTGFLSDLRYAVRSLRRAPVYTGLALLTLTLGIGATASIFSLINGVVLQPLPYEDSERLVRVGFIAPRALCERNWGGNRCDRLIGSSAPMLNAWRERTTLFEGMAGTARQSIVLLGDGGPQRIPLAAITEDFFSVLRVEPAIGRAFAGDEYDQGADVAVVSHGFWRDRLGEDQAGRDDQRGGQGL